MPLTPLLSPLSFSLCRLCERERSSPAVIMADPISLSPQSLSFSLFNPRFCLKPLSPAPKMEATKLNELKVFVEQCRAIPAALSYPALAFFREYLERRLSASALASTRKADEVVLMEQQEISDTYTS